MKNSKLFLLAMMVGAVVSLKAHPVSAGKYVYPSLRARELDIVDGLGLPRIQFAMSGEGGPGFWLTTANKSASLEGGVHPNGFPFLLVSDGAIRNFGLGRVDGRNASPILVYRVDDIVRMVFGLSMTESGQPAFLSMWNTNGKKTDYIGTYGDCPSRACTQ